MNEDQFQFEECFNMVCGDKLGEGMSRTVFASTLTPDCVIKVEKRPWFQNVYEDNVWNRISETAFANWFAPVVALSPYGRVLVMKRTTPAPKDAFPRKVPAFFTDLKRSNWGLLNGKLVCHDYGTNLLLERGMTRAMKVADWYDES